MFLALSKNKDQILSVSHMKAWLNKKQQKKREKKNEHLNVNASLALAWFV